MLLDNMAKLIGYAMMSANKNAINNGHLVKAMCEFCGRKFGSIKEARKCETKHLNDAIRKDLNEAIKIKFYSLGGRV